MSQTRLFERSLSLSDGHFENVAAVKRVNEKLFYVYIVEFSNMYLFLFYQLCNWLLALLALYAFRIVVVERHTVMYEYLLSVMSTVPFGSNFKPVYN